MRNLKKLFAVILTVAMLASLMVPALAANDYVEEALALQAINVFAGGPDDLNLDEGVSRIQGLAFAIRAAGKDAEALALTDADADAILADWVDDAEITGWQRKYAAYAIKNGITVGVSSTEKRLNSNELITGTSFLVFIMRAGMGYADVTTADVVEKALEAKILTAAQAAVYAKAPTLIRDDAAGILFGAFTTGVNADGTKLIDAYIASGATTDAAAAEAGFIKANAMTAKATKVDTLVVTFETAVDTADLNLAVSKAGSKVDAAAPVWSDGNKVATVKTTAKMTNGTYTVTATSAADENFKLVATVEITSQYVAEIVILNDVALTGKSSSTAKEGDVAYVYYDVLDQYGQSLRTSSSIQWSASTNHSENRTKGVLTLNRSDSRVFTYGEKIYITGVYSKTGVSVSKEVSVGMKQALDSIEVAGFVKKGTTEILKSLPAGFKDETYYLVYTANDQNGNPLSVDKPITNSEVTFVSDNVLLVKEVKAGETTLIIGGEEYNAVYMSPGLSVDKGGEANITAIANKTGNKTVINVAVGADQILTSFTMSSPSGVLADGETYEIPFTALDQNGKAITNFTTLAKQADFNKLTFTASPGTLKLSEKADGTAKLEYSDETINWNDSESTDGIDRIASLTSILVGGGTDNLTLNIQDKARPVAIKSVNMDNVLVEGGSTTVKFNGNKDGDDKSSFLFIDQYGREMDNDKAGEFFATTPADLKGMDYADYNFVVRATFKGDEGYFTGLTPNLETEIEYNTNFVIEADNAIDVKSAKSGFALKFEIVKYKTSKTFADDAQAVSPAKNEDLTIVDISAVKSFSVGDINKFYVNTDASDSDTGKLYGLYSGSEVGTDNILDPITGDVIPADYNHGVSVKGTYNGEEVSIPDTYLTVTSGKLEFGTDGKVISTSGDAIKWSDFYDVKTSNYLRKDASDTVKVTVKSKAAAVIDTLSKDIKISDEKPSVTTIEVKESITLDPENTNLDAAYIAKEIDLKVKDQYGVEMKGEAVSYKIASIVANADGYAENNFRVSGNDTATISVVGAERGDTFVLTVKVGSKTADVKVTVGADKNANIIESTNNYIDELIGKADGTTLEYQRIAGLQ